MDHTQATPAVRHDNNHQLSDALMYRRDLDGLLEEIDLQHLDYVDQTLSPANVEISTQSASYEASKALRAFHTTDDARFLDMMRSDLGTTRLLIYGDVKFNLGLVLGAAIQYRADARAAATGPICINSRYDAIVDYSSAWAQATRAVDRDWRERSEAENATVTAQAAKVEADPLSVALAAIEAAADYRTVSQEEAMDAVARIIEAAMGIASAFADPEAVTS